MNTENISLRTEAKVAFFLYFTREANEVGVVFKGHTYFGRVQGEIVFHRIHEQGIAMLIKGFLIKKKKKKKSWTR